MTASVIKSDPNTQKIQKNAYLLCHRQHDANVQGNPLLQATKRHFNSSERVKNNDMRSEVTYLLLLLCSVEK